VDLTGVYLAGVHLAGVHLTGVYLTGVHFTELLTPRYSESEVAPGRNCVPKLLPRSIPLTATSLRASLSAMKYPRISLLIRLNSVATSSRILA
jgi:hypothetical protein